MNFVRVAGRLVNLRHVVHVQKGDLEHAFTLTPHLGSSFMALGSGNADLEPLCFEVSRKDHPEDFTKISAWIDSFPTF